MQLFCWFDVICAPRDLQFWFVDWRCTMHRADIQRWRMPLKTGTQNACGGCWNVAVPILRSKAMCESALSCFSYTAFVCAIKFDFWFWLYSFHMLLLLSSRTDQRRWSGPAIMVTLSAHDCWWLMGPRKRPKILCGFYSLSSHESILKYHVYVMRTFATGFICVE